MRVPRVTSHQCYTVREFSKFLKNHFNLKQKRNHNILYLFQSKIFRMIDTIRNIFGGD